MFWREYIERIKPWQLQGFETESRDGTVRCRAKLLRDGKLVEFAGEGNGPLAALVHGFTKAGVPRFEISNYSEHALAAGEEASASRISDQARRRPVTLGRGRGHEHRACVRRACSAR